MKHGLKFSLAISVVFMSLVGCSNQRLFKLEEQAYYTSGVSVDVCTQRADEIHTNLKFIFVVDRSGSNQQRFNPAPIPGTDPSGDRRFLPMKNFINRFNTDPYIHWSMINFGTTAGVVQQFTTDKNAFYNFVDGQHTNTAQIDRDGWTNYLGGLDAARTLIQNDINAAKSRSPIVTSHYVIFFVSDGAPIVEAGLQSTSDIMNRMNSIMSFETSEQDYVEGVQVHTGLYYSDATPDMTAKDLLLQIAIRGKGDALEFGQGQDIDFNKFALPVRVQRFEMREIWVDNVSTLWHNDLMALDTDHDGLRDAYELTLGSDPTKYDSDGNGIGDGVEFRATGGKACKDAQCSRTNAYAYACGFVPTIDAQGNKLYNDLDKDDLNDCEEQVLKSSPTKFDSNNDYIPDGHAFRHGIGFIQGSTEALLDPDLDGVNNYYELKENTPIRVPNSTVPGLKHLRYTLSKTSEDAIQTCYHVDIWDMPEIGNGNTVRVYFLQNTAIVGEKKLMKRAEGVLINGSVRFSDMDFK